MLASTSNSTGGRAAAPMRSTSVAAPATTPRGPRRPAGRGNRLLRRTSEHWYEDELEYDAVKEILDPKRVLVVAAGSLRADGEGAVGAATSPPPPPLPALRYAVAFSSKQALDSARAAWEALGRAGPPLFLKVRERAALTELDEASPAPSASPSPSASASAAEAFWAELAGQNWRTELDYGLGLDGTSEAASSSREREEPVLVFLSRAEAARALAAHAGEGGGGVDGGGGGGGAAAALREVRLSGWNQEPDPEKHRPLESWRDLLALAPTDGARV